MGQCGLSLSLSLFLALTIPDSDSRATLLQAVQGLAGEVYVSSGQARKTGSLGPLLRPGLRHRAAKFRAAKDADGGRWFSAGKHGMGHGGFNFLRRRPPNQPFA